MYVSPNKGTHNSHNFHDWHTVIHFITSTKRRSLTTSESCRSPWFISCNWLRNSCGIESFFNKLKLLSRTLRNLGTSWPWTMFGTVRPRLSSKASASLYTWMHVWRTTRYNQIFFKNWFWMSSVFTSQLQIKCTTNHFRRPLKGLFSKHLQCASQKHRHILTITSVIVLGGKLSTSISLLD